MGKKELIDVLCVGMTPFDITVSMDHHPQPDEKCYADDLALCCKKVGACLAIPNRNEVEEFLQNSRRM